MTMTCQYSAGRNESSLPRATCQKLAAWHSKTFGHPTAILNSCRNAGNLQIHHEITLSPLSVVHYPLFPQHFSTYDLSSKSAEQVDTSGITSLNDHLFLDVLRNHANRYRELPISITLSQIRFCDPQFWSPLIFFPQKMVIFYSYVKLPEGSDFPPFLVLPYKALSF